MYLCRSLACILTVRSADTLVRFASMSLKALHILAFPSMQKRRRVRAQFFFFPPLYYSHKYILRDSIAVSACVCGRQDKFCLLPSSLGFDSLSLSVSVSLQEKYSIFRGVISVRMTCTHTHRRSPGTDLLCARVADEPLPLCSAGTRLVHLLRSGRPRPYRLLQDLCFP